MTKQGTNSGTPVRHALPQGATRFIGRAAEVQQVIGLLANERLVSLTGPPGSGKTRLALEVAREALDQFAEGAWFIPLAPIQDPSLIPSSVAEVLGLKEAPATPFADVIDRALADAELLLVFDNFEHVLDGSDLVARWLRAAPKIRVLTTSRAALHLSQEHEFFVPPLSVPADAHDPAAGGAEAVQLFRERARAVLPGFEIDAAALPEVAQICRRLDGLPLAVELAAARIKLLPLAAILARLERSLDLLTAAPRDSAERHRSLHAAISWSYGLLGPAEQVFLRRLAVFRGGWELEAADAVAGATAEFAADPLELSASLLDKSLIQRDLRATHEARYEMLETLREYGRERSLDAGDGEAIEERHARWYLDLAERAAPELTSQQQGHWLDRLERESDNLRAALRWTIDRRQPEIGLRLAAALWRFWQIRAHIAEGRQLLEELLALDIAVDARVRAHALSAAGSLAYWQNDQGAAVPYYEASVELRRGFGDPAELASGLYDLGHSLSMPGPRFDSARGRAFDAEALEIYQGLDDRLGIARLTWSLGCNSDLAGDHATAVGELSRSIELFRQLDDPFGLAWALTMHGLAAGKLGQLDAAGDSWREALRIFAAVDDVSGLDSVLDHFAWHAKERGDPLRAVRLAAAGTRLRGVSQSGVIDIVRAPRGLPRPEGELSAEEIDAAWAEGEAMTTAEAVAYALLPDARSDDAAAGVVRLRVHALGPMRVERGGEAIRRWGGAKAGSRQAQAIFAFLFDRGTAGITKDEATEMLWPDLPIRRGDLAFHRTLGGLRSVLERGEQLRPAVTYDGGRYRLDPKLVAWTDVGEFERRLEAAAELDGEARVHALEAAHDVYRGDLLDDCPFYGESSFVEERRTYLRGRFEDLLVDLGDALGAIGDTSGAAARYREALTVNAECRRAEAGIQRLGSGLPVTSLDPAGG